MRIVSLNCSNTEIVCALSLSESLVGVDDHSDFPPKVVGKLPRVGPDLEPDMEKVKALKPDLVLASLTVPGHEKVIENLEKAGLKYLAPEPITLDDVYSDIRLIAQAVGADDEAVRVISGMKDAIAGNRSASPHRPSILVQWWPKPVITPGRLSWVNDLIQIAGASNPLGDEEVKSRPLEDKEVCNMDPDAIVMSWCGVDPRKYRSKVIYGKSEWADLQAVRNGRVYAVPEAYLGRPSPRLTSGSRALHSIVQALATGTSDYRRSDLKP